MSEALTINELRRLCAVLGDGVDDRRAKFLDAPDPDKLHNLRVAVRSARSLLVLTRDSFESEQVTPARHAGARLSYLTGRARNLDVFVEHWKELTFGLDPEVVVNLGPALSKVNESRVVEYRLIKEFLEGDEAAVFSTELRRLATAPSTSEKADDVVRKAIRRINKRVLAVSNALSDLAPDEVLHQARKDLKKMRYSLEMTRSHFPTRQLERFVEIVSDLQSVIGRHQDAVTFSNELWSVGRRLAQTGAADSVISIGILLNPIDDVRRNARRKSLARLRAYAEDEPQQTLKKLIGNID
jgi:CHAD domain-containing protein